jgi:predicted TIM-barrel fold metal-dependent hydrolase
MSTETPQIVISSDAHIGPRVVEDLRPYVPTSYLDTFDSWRMSTANSFAVGYAGEHKVRQHERNLKTAGHYDMSARLCDMDADGVAAEVLFHDSINGERIPFVDNGFFYEYSSVDLELVAVGYDAYNHWLADAVATQPERFVALAYLPLWDVSDAVEAAKQSSDMGLRAVNFPSPRPGLPEYDDPEWEPFWSVCEERNLPLCTHAGGAQMSNFSGPQAGAMLMLEGGGWPARRAMHRMIFGGVFERHPNLKLVLTEVSGGWFKPTMREFDSAWNVYRGVLREQMRRKPSEYFSTNVFIGMSFPAPFDTEEAVRDGFSHNAMWGSDYPHPEGTWQYPESGSGSTTRENLRYAFSGLSDAEIKRMIHDNAIEVYGFNRTKLEQVAAQIDAPTLDEIKTPLANIPEREYSYAFRTLGPWS